MGLVWRAEDTLLNRPVAVKEVEIPAGLPDDEREALEARVMREARAAARLNHPNVVTVFDVVEDEGRTFIVMELIEAPTLAEMVENQGALSPERAREVGLEVLSAIEAAHTEGIVHRDVKPGNVMIPPTGRVKLGDFGIASVKGDPKLTSTGLILGSPSYMAPEQATSATSGPEADLWALGALLYFAVEGEPPFDKGQALPTLAAVVGEEPKPVSHVGPLRTAIEALMSKEPAARPTIAEARAMLEGTDLPVMAPAAPPKKTPLIAIGAAVMLGIAALAGWAILDNGDDPQDPAAPNNETSRDAGVTVPNSWTTYRSDITGHSIAYPPSWEVDESSIDDSSTDFLDPSSSTYLRLDWTDTPGDSPAGAWRSLEQSFEASHEGYSRIGITPTTFKGMDAATWEFTYVDGGVTLHAIDLGFVTTDDSYGFALNFQTLEEDWEGAQPRFSSGSRRASGPPKITPNRSRRLLRVPT
jgi:serine/threonine protein kinase